jgi:hypothetical protein
MPERKYPRHTCLLGTDSGTGEFVDLSDSPSPPAGEFVEGMRINGHHTPSTDVSLVSPPPTCTVIDGKCLPFYA